MHTSLLHVHQKLFSLKTPILLLFAKSVIPFRGRLFHTQNSPTPMCLGSVSPLFVERIQLMTRVSILNYEHWVVFFFFQKKKQKALFRFAEDYSYSELAETDPEFGACPKEAI
jgi:hypothetical protein